MVPPKLIFLIAQARAIVLFFYIGRYLSDKCFDIVWEYHPPSGPQMDPPKINFLNSLSLGISLLLYQQMFKRQILYHGLRRPLLWKPPKMIPQKSIFLYVIS